MAITPPSVFQLAPIQVSGKPTSQPKYDYAQIAKIGCVITIVPANGTDVITITNPIGVATSNATTGGATCIIELSPDQPLSFNTQNNTTVVATNFKTYVDLIVPMSFVTVCMNRGADEYPVFVGIVTDVTESYRRSDRDVIHTGRVTCRGLEYYLSHTMYFSLAFLGARSSAAFNLGTQAGTIMYKAAYINKSPVDTATFYYNNVVAPYVNQTSINTLMGGGPLNNVVGGIINPSFGDLDLPGYDTMSAQFPFLPEFYTSDAAWIDKFSTFFPDAFYERFMLSLVSGTQNGTSNKGPLLSNYGIATPFAGGTVEVPGTLDTYTVNPTFVCRQIPYAYVGITDVPTSGQVITETTDGRVLQDSNWNALFNREFSDTDIISSDLKFSINDIYSMYILWPQQMANALGVNNSAQVVNFYLMAQAYGVIFDRNAYNKYGYKPITNSIEWLYAGFTTSAMPVVPKADFDLFLTNMALFTAQLKAPNPVMASGTIRIPLTPSLCVGTRLVCSPFARSVRWTFYVTGVSHEYDFGGMSFTEVEVSRGLPSSIYEQQGGQALLEAILLGRGIRDQGNYQITESGFGLTLMGLDNGDKLIPEAVNQQLIPQGI